ncbi:hypothetical protein BGY98DRAFT_969790, partial [Russula aff. rugulosa BPL654]
MAVLNRRVEVVRVLLEHGASVDAEDDEGETPSQIAAASGDDDIMEVLLEYGAKLKGPDKQVQTELRRVENPK